MTLSHWERKVTQQIGPPKAPRLIAKRTTLFTSIAVSHLYLQLSVRPWKLNGLTETISLKRVLRNWFLEIVFYSMAIYTVCV